MMEDARGPIDGGFASQPPHPSAPPPPRSRAGLIAAIALVACAVGAVLVVLALRHQPTLSGWLGIAPDAAPAPVASPTPAPATPDLATLAGRETALSAQIAALEARTAALDNNTAAAGGQATRAEAMLILAVVRRAVERGVGLGYLEEQLRLRFGASAPREAAIVIQAAHTPVTLEDLRESLETASPTLLAAPSDWWAGIGTELRQLVVIHRAGTPSPLPADRLARARRMLRAGQVEAAMAEVERLPGAADAQAWLGAARRYVAVRRALDRLEAVAIVGPAADDAAPVPSPTPASVPPVT